MSKLIIQSVQEEDLYEILSFLKSKKLLADTKTCQLCSKDLLNIGGFLPKNGKIMPICNTIECGLKASFLVMKYNGNGSPIIEK